ncbi:hypothetical protein MKX01_000688 [Papaver californicum]|nr:hypothetical protein MKX01_000688 [Papaver californicum]
MEGKLPDLLRSPRLIDPAGFLELTAIENGEEKQCHSKLDGQQTHVQLQLRRILAKAKPNSMAGNKRETHLERRRNTYHMQRMKVGENRNQGAGTSYSKTTL